MLAECCSKDRWPIESEQRVFFQCVLHSRHNQALEVQWGKKPNNSISFMEPTVWGHPKKTRPGRHAIFSSVCFSLAFLGHGPHSSKNIPPEIWIRSNHFSDYETKTYENKQTKKEQQPRCHCQGLADFPMTQIPPSVRLFCSQCSSASICLGCGHSVFLLLSSDNPLFIIFSDSF